MAIRILLALAITLTSGCSLFVQPEVVIKREPIEVEVPVYMPTPTPDALRAPLMIASSELPVFISPKDTGAVSCLAKDHEQKLRLLLVTLMGRVKEWEAYGIN